MPDRPLPRPGDVEAASEELILAYRQAVDLRRDGAFGDRQARLSGHRILAAATVLCRMQAAVKDANVSSDSPLAEALDGAVDPAVEVLKAAKAAHNAAGLYGDRAASLAEIAREATAADRRQTVLAADR